MICVTTDVKFRSSIRKKGVKEKKGQKKSGDSLFENGNDCSGSGSQGMTAFYDNHSRALQPAVDSNL
jgi:hypothetical protein